ncbi:MAG: hypothetical protein RLW62_23665 [Gammaproteobacteria bacterium]
MGAIWISYLLGFGQLAIGLASFGHVGPPSDNTWLKVYVFAFVPSAIALGLQHKAVAAAVDRGIVSSAGGFLGHRVWVASLVVLYLSTYFRG